MKDTLTNLFWSPILGLINKGISGMYWSDDSVEAEHKYIYIVCGTEEQVNTIRDNPNYTTEYLNQTLEGEVTIMVCLIPDKWIEDYKWFIQGKYTKMSKEYKEHVVNEYRLHKRFGTANSLEGLFNRTKERKELTYRRFCAKLEDGRYVEDKELHYEIFINDELELWSSPCNDIIIHTNTI